MNIELFKDGDLDDLFSQLEQVTEEAVLDPEMDASHRRYAEIIKKHKSDSI